MTQNPVQLTVSREEIGRVQDWVGDVLKALKPEEVKRLLSKQDLLQTKLLVLLHQFDRHDTPFIYHAKVNGQVKQFQIISPCPGREWIPAWDFVNRMKVSGRLTTLDDVSGFAAAYPEMGFSEQPILAGGRYEEDRKSDDLDFYSFHSFRNGEIVRRSCKGMPKYYRYLALLG
jgi:hypothetical protein